MATPFKLGDENIDIPTGWHELKLSHYIALEEMQQSESDLENKFRLLSILSEVDLDKWMNAELNSINVAQLNQSTAWISKKIHWKKFPKPAVITIDGRELKVPVNLELERVGQHVDFEKRVYPLVQFDEDGNVKNIPASIYPIALAIYLQPQYLNGDYSADDLDEMIQLCKEAPFVQAVTLANFFLRSPYASQLLKEIYNTRKTTNKRQQASTDSKNTDSKT
jgi:hypothetical protein